ncbi:lysis system i-spanin subunit Rz [Caballeronia sp. HLA56]
MSAYLITGLTACAVGFAAGGAALHVFDSSQLANERAAHARDNEVNAQKLASLSESAAKAASKAVAAHNAAITNIAKLDDQYHHERKTHEVDNAKNRAAIADGTRRVRIAISNARCGHTSDPSAAAGGVGDGTRRYAELSPEVGKYLFEIADDADTDARAKAEYLQQYVATLQRHGLVARSRLSGEGFE